MALMIFSASASDREAIAAAQADPDKKPDMTGAESVFALGASRVKPLVPASP
jgi:hypothetical protein